MQSVLPILLKYLLNLADFLLLVAIFDSYIYMLGAGNLFPGTNRLCLLASWELFVNISISLTPPISRDITESWYSKLAITNLLITTVVFTKAFFSPDRLISLCCLYSQEEISIAKFGAEVQHSSALNNSGGLIWLQGVSRDNFPGLQESLHYTP